MKDVMILTMTAGGGHNAAASALAESFAHDETLVGPEGNEVRVESLDVATMSPRVVRHVYNDGYLRMIDRDPQLYGWMYHRFDRRPGRRRRAANKTLERFGSRRFIRYLRRRNPHVCVCTHFYPAQIALDLRKRGKLSSRVVMVITDYQPHDFWILEGVDEYATGPDPPQAQV